MQTVTVTGQQDFVIDGNQPFEILLSQVSSTDTDYDKIVAPDVSLTTIEDANEIVTGDSPAVLVSTPSGTVTEAGGAASFTVQLATAPTSDVTIPVSSSNTDTATVDIAELVFTSANWDDAQAVSVTGVQDYANAGDRDFSVVLDAVISSDSAYSGIDAVDVQLTNIEVSNQPPLINLPAAQVLNEDDSLTLSVNDSNAITLSDPDADADGSTANLQLSLSVSQGTLSLSQPNGLSFSAPSDGTADTSLTATGTADARMLFLMD